MPGPLETYLRSNKRFWDKVTPLHIESDHYREKRNLLLQGQSALDPIVTPLLGDLAGRAVMQPLCHLGYDVLSLRQLGAKSAAGWDFNECACGHANEIAQQLGLGGCLFRVASLPDFASKLPGPFDLVLVSYGSLCWVPHLRDFFKRLAQVLGPEAKLVIADFHPLLFCFDFLQSASMVHQYLDQAGPPIKISRIGSYASPEVGGETTSFNWNHSIADIQGSLRAAGFAIDHFEEHDFLPESSGFPNLTPGADGLYRPVTPFTGMPLMFTLKATAHGIPV